MAENNSEDASPSVDSRSKLRNDARKKIQRLLKSLSAAKDTIQQGRLCATLTEQYLILGRVKKAEEYALYAQNLGQGARAWCSYARHFSKLYFSGKRYVKNYPVLEEIIAGYELAAQDDKALAYYLLGNFFEEVGRKGQAVRAYSAATTAYGTGQFRDLAAQKMAELQN